MEEFEKIIAAKFPSFEKELLHEMGSVSEIKTFQPGEVLMRTGQYIKSTMLVLDGLVKIYREDNEGNEFFMYYIDAGKACAISLLCAQRQDTSEVKAKTVTEATVLSIPFEKIDQWVAKYKSWNYFALNSYRERFEELLLTLDHTAFRNMDERLIFYLKRHQEKLKSNRIPVSITEIAQELNSSREVISRLLKKLSEKGLLEQHRSYIEIRDLNRVLA